MTRLDALVIAMQTGQEEAALRFYQALADSDLVLLLDGKTGVRPKVFDLSEGPMILAYDLEERLSATHGAADYAALPGRVLAGQMLGQGLSLGLNLGSEAPSEMVLPPDALRWLCDMLDRQVQVDETQVLGFAASRLGPRFRTSLEFTLAAAAGLISAAGLVAVTARQGAGGPSIQEVVVIFGAPAAAEEPLARAVSEAASFAGLESDGVAVQFLIDVETMPKSMRPVISMIDLPAPSDKVETIPGALPGMDPNHPPKLR
jgi:hypothetical protein